MVDYRTGNTDLVTYLKLQGTIKVLPFEDKASFLLFDFGFSNEF